MFGSTLNGSELVIAGIAIVPAILGLVSFAKTLGMQGKSLTILSFVLGVIAFAVFRLQEMFPVIQPWVELVVFALLGPITSGLHDQWRENATGVR